VYQRISAHRFGWLASVLAFAVVVGAAYYKLFVLHAPLAASLKQNLSWLRAGNFVAIAWLVANLIELGWARKVARRLPWVGAIGRQGLLCFIAGAVISLVIDSVLYAATDGYLNYPFGLLADAVALGALFAVALGVEPLKRLVGRIVTGRLETSP
jgi:hypothetical protein